VGSCWQYSGAEAGRLIANATAGIASVQTHTAELDIEECDAVEARNALQTFMARLELAFQQKNAEAPVNVLV
jgi:hypothetical protein